VGDAEFQKKAIGKMQDISKGEGRTVLFVSHNMVAVKNLCTRAIVLEHGSVVFEGTTENSIDFYIKNKSDKISKEFVNTNLGKECGIKDFVIKSIIQTGANFEFEMTIYSKIKTIVQVAVTFCTNESQPIYQIYSGHVGDSFKIESGENKIKVLVESLPLIHGIYELNLWLGTTSLTYDFYKNVINIEVDEGAIKPGGPISSKNGYPIIQNAIWEQL
jgi:lipopolysaccharide transport system ATP-binding protein